MRSVALLEGARSAAGEKRRNRSGPKGAGARGAGDAGGARGGGEPPGSIWERLGWALGWLVSGLAPLVALGLALRGEPFTDLTLILLGAPASPAHVADTYSFIVVALTAAILIVWGLRPMLLTVIEGALGLAILISLHHIPFGALGGWVIVNMSLASALVALVLISARYERTQREAAWLRYRIARTRALGLGRNALLLAPGLTDQERMDAFIGMASHELRTPLTTIKGSVQLALRRLNREGTPGPIDEDLRLLLMRADQQVGRMTRLVDDLLDTSRVALGQLALRFEQCDLFELARIAIHDAQTRAPTRAISLESDGAPALVWGDPARLTQAVEIYLANALKFSDASKPVEVRVWGHWRAKDLSAGDEWQVRVAVRDYGPGIKRKALTHIWERFYQDPDLATQVGSEIGLGLGLYLCRAIIEAHDGEVGVENARGGGALFWFTAPALIEDGIEEDDEGDEENDEEEFVEE
jgi:signal transduction histidine kinase